MPEFRYIVSTDLELNRDEANYLIDCFQSNWDTKHHLCEGGKFRGVINQLESCGDAIVEVNQYFINVLINKVIAYHNIPSKEYSPELKAVVRKKLLDINTLINNEIRRISADPTDNLENV